MISSAAHPSDRPALMRKLFSSQPGINPSCGGFEFYGALRRSNYDHFHAVPLSDGYHVLFVDSLNDTLALGCDPPAGGSTEFLRRIFFVPPQGGMVPKLYTAASDLTHGARIVAVYGETIMLYSVPPDMIILSQLEQKEEGLGSSACFPFGTKLHKDHWLNWLDEHMPFGAGHQTEAATFGQVWPIVIRGTVIGTLKGIRKVAVQIRPDIVIWALTHSLQFKSWRLRNSSDPTVPTKQYVCRNGIVHPVDGTSDVNMADTLPHLPASTATGLLGCDGQGERSGGKSSSAPELYGHPSSVIKRVARALAIENDECVDMVDVRGCSDAWYDGEGDVVMIMGL
jgi:hypothetical protein